MAMQLQQAHDRLRNAKTERRDWREVAEILDEIVSSAAWKGRHDTPMGWYQEAAEISGYSVGVLRRMAALSGFLKKAKGEFDDYEKLTSESRRFPFATMEILKRIFDMDPEKAKELFPKILKRDITHREVQEVYSSFTGPPQRFRGRDGQVSGKLSVGAEPRAMNKYGARAGKEFACYVFEAAKVNATKLTGNAKASLHFQRYKFDYASPDAVAVLLKGSAVEWVDGFDCRFINSGLVRGRRIQLVSEVALAATYFRQYWLIVPKAGHLGMSLVHDVRTLELHSVGVAEFDKERPENLRVLLKPELPPVPDRQAAAREHVIEKGVPKELGSRSNLEHMSW